MNIIDIFSQIQKITLKNTIYLEFLYFLRISYFMTMSFKPLWIDRSVSSATAAVLGYPYFGCLPRASGISYPCILDALINFFTYMQLYWICVSYVFISIQLHFLMINLSCPFCFCAWFCFIIQSMIWDFLWCLECFPRRLKVQFSSCCFMFHVEKLLWRFYVTYKFLVFWEIFSLSLSFTRACLYIFDPHEIWLGRL